jgi:hypothetical protein
VNVDVRLGFVVVVVVAVHVELVAVVVVAVMKNVVARLEKKL